MLITENRHAEKGCLMAYVDPTYGPRITSTGQRLIPPQILYTDPNDPTYGYGDVLSDYDSIQNNDDVIKFISSSPMFDSDDYKGQTMNHSDRKRVRAGRPSADYIRTSLIGLNKHKQISDPDYFLKRLFPDKYQMLLDKQKEIESFTPVKSKYGGEWLMVNFPQLKPGPVLGKIKQYWTQKYGDNLDNVPEDELRKDTDIYIKAL